MSYDVLLTSDSLADLELWKHLESCGWAANATKIPSLKGEPGTCGGVGVARFLIKNSTGEELPLWRLSCNFTRTDGRLGLTMEDKATPRAVGGSSSPIRTRSTPWVPGDTWHWVLLCLGIVTDVIATAVAKHKSKGQCYLPREYHRRWTVQNVRRETMKRWSVGREEISQDSVFRLSCSTFCK